MRVAMTCDYPVDPRYVPGGVTAVAHHLVHGLGRIEGLDLHVVCCQRDVARDAVEKRDGATIHFLTNSDRLTLTLDARLQRRKIARTMKRIAPDLVHAQGLGLATAAALDSGLPFLLSLHGIIWKEGCIRLPTWRRRLRGRLRAWRARRQILRATNVVITSGYAAEVLPKERAYRTFALNNPVSERVFAIRNEPKGQHVLLVGGTRQRKDPMTAIRTMERVVAEIPDAAMTIVGPPSGTSLDREVAAEVAARGLVERIRLRGLVPEEELFAEYARASVVLLTSIEETAPVAIGEAFAAGIPVVGTDAGGIPHMVRDGETGFVRPVGDDAALAAAVVSLLKQPELRARMARRAREVGESDFSLPAIARRTFEIYAEILAG
jgi:glycosyltransferase involved in cell wall biosynthesis